MPPGPSRLSRLDQMRASIVAAADRVPTVATTEIVAALAKTISAEAAAAAIDVADMPRAWRAIRNRDEVARLSIDGTPVAQIAATLGISQRRVCFLRAQLGVGRRRR